MKDYVEAFEAMAAKNGKYTHILLSSDDKGTYAEMQRLLDRSRLSPEELKRQAVCSMIATCSSPVFSPVGCARAVSLATLPLVTCRVVPFATCHSRLPQLRIATQDDDSPARSSSGMYTW